MLRNAPRPFARMTPSSRGFALIEMMVALVVGLIIIGAVLALVVALMRSNRQTLETTRLTQELRATMAVISADVRRARGIDDPLSSKGAAGLLVNPYSEVEVAGDCIKFAYDGATGGRYHVIRRANNKVVMATAVDKASVTCASTGTELNSDQVSIDSLAFDLYGATDPNSLRKIKVTLTGRLRGSADPQVSGVQRVIEEVVYIRSVGSG